MKKLLLSCGLLLTTTAFAGELHTYNDLVTAISNGTPLHFVTNFTQCTTSKKNAATTMSMASFTPNEIGVTDNYIATAITHFTLNDPFFPNKPVNEYVRYTITPDNNMSATLHVLDATSNASLMEPITFNCKIDEATKVYY